jgi:hypothetical protein
MPADQTTLHVLAVIGLATVFRSAFGFGEALVAVPLRIAGLWVWAVTRYYLMSLPVVLVAIVLGRVVNRRLDGKRFIVYVHVGLVVIGGLLLFQSASGWGRS